MDDTLIITSLEQAGIEPEAAKLYVRLLDYGPATALQLARLTNISRTQIYRFVDQLAGFGLAQQFPGSSAYLAQPISKLAAVLDARQQQIQQLRTDLAEASKLRAEGTGAVSIEVLPGLGGISQSLWEIARHGHDYVAMSPTIIGNQLNRERQQAFYHLLYDKSRNGRLLSNTRLVSQTEIAPLTSELLSCRQIDPEVLPIDTETVVAGDRAWLFNAAGATAITSPSLSAQLSQLFESYWQLAAPADIV
jgi:hypothetical protein